MSIIRTIHNKENPYAQILTSLIRDESISPNCRWLIMYLSSNKNGLGISIQQIIDHLKGQIEKDEIYEIFNEAIEAGYIEKEWYEIKRGELCE